MKHNINFSVVVNVFNSAMFMKRFKLSKSKKIILILLVVNTIAFSTAKSYAKKYNTASVSFNETQQIDYIEKGWQIINWSYNLLKYFKKPNTN
ncbi:MAG: hypothetical protein IT243_00860 [Bacteroidia bacterium]|nr:hypothetical protein [Bacteroidia bacterium]